MVSSEPTRARILVVDDDDAMVDYLTEGLTQGGFAVEGFTEPNLALARVADGSFDAAVTDLRMRGMTGLELCERIHARAADLPVLVLTAFGDYESAVQAVRAGAYEFLSKPVRLDVLTLALGRAAAAQRLRRRVQTLEASLEAATGFGDLVGTSAAMKSVQSLIERVATSAASVLVTGESGTGKELVARELHRKSRRAEGPFVAINCAALPEALLESELFGHEKGAFTDAKTARKGLFLEANGGTLFLDEVGELSLALQAKLLRALQERRVRPLGSHGAEVPFDVRLVAATNRDLEGAVHEKRFREDFLFRINVIEIPLPPLRARDNDVLLLASHFIKTFAARARKNVVGYTDATAALLLQYAWPGNVRELQNAMERAIAMTSTDKLAPEDLPPRVFARDSRAPKEAPTELITLEECERRHILRVLEAFGGNRMAAARTLGLDRTTLWRKLERYRIPDS